MGVFSDGAGTGLYCTAPAAKVNYRSLGRGSGGVGVSAKKNTSRRDPDVLTMPSIPGKFETVLYRGNRDDKGFGSAAPRFGQESRKGEEPGPGAHAVPTGLALQGLTDSTVGKRGNGPFASRVSRQKDPKVQAPGPGAYLAQSEPSSARNSSAAPAPSAVFVPPTSVNPAKFNARAAPGPGDYSGAIGLYTPRNKPEATGAFIPKAGEHGEPDHGGAHASDIPGPGYYDEKGRTISEVAARAGRSGPSLLKRRAMGPKSGDAGGNLSEVALLRLSSQVLAAESSRATAGGIGPGQYDPKPEVTSSGKVQSVFSVSESSAFQHGNSHMSRRWRPHGPGPGDYEAPASPNARNTAANAFSSLVHRFEDKEPSAPGPAYYPPRKRPDNDFHLNPEQMWV